LLEGRFAAGFVVAGHNYARVGVSVAIAIAVAVAVSGRHGRAGMGAMQLEVARRRCAFLLLHVIDVYIMRLVAPYWNESGSVQAGMCSGRVSALRLTSEDRGLTQSIP
jgi:hypothetical protein